MLSPSIFRHGRTIIFPWTAFSTLSRFHEDLGSSLVTVVGVNEAMRIIQLFKE
ncbi:MAG: hypothetical protein QXK12_07460 [Candidatus Nezhaarchaeales archaeon]